MAIPARAQVPIAGDPPIPDAPLTTIGFQFHAIGVGLTDIYGYVTCMVQEVRHFW